MIFRHCIVLAFSLLIAVSGIQAQKISCGNSPKGVTLYYQGPLSFKQIELFANGSAIGKLQVKTEAKAIRKAYEKAREAFPDYVPLSTKQLAMICDSMPGLKSTERLPTGYYLVSKLATGLAYHHEKGNTSTTYTARMDGKEINVEWEQKESNLPDNLLSPYRYKSNAGNIQTSWLVKPGTGALFVRLFRKSHEEITYLPVSDAIMRTASGGGDTVLVIAQDTSLPKLSYYQYAVSAYDFYGNASNPSAPFLADNLDNSTMPIVLKFIAEENPKTQRMEIRYKVDYAERVKSMVLQRSAFKDRGFENVASLGSTDTLYSDDIVNPMEAVYYRLVINDIKAPRFSTPVVPAVSHAKPAVFPPQRPYVEWNGKFPLISWEISDTSARGYKVYRTEIIGGTPALVSPLVFFQKGKKSYQWIDSSLSLKPGVTYHYAVAGQGKGYTESEFSGFSSIQIPDTEKPQAPAAPYLNTLANGHVSIIWKSIGGDQTTHCTYNVYRCGQKNGAYTRINSGLLFNTNQFTDTLASTSDSLYYAITSVNTGGVESVRSMPTGILVDETLQAIPLLIVKQGEGAIFQWPGGNPQIVGIELEYMADGASTVQQIKTSAYNKEQLTLEPAKPGSYRIRGINAQGRKTREGNWVSYP
jgi:hypothetical protein